MGVRQRNRLRAAGKKPPAGTPQLKQLPIEPRTLPDPDAPPKLPTKNKKLLKSLRSK